MDDYLAFIDTFFDTQVPRFKAVHGIVIPNQLREAVKVVATELDSDNVLRIRGHMPSLAAFRDGKAVGLFWPNEWHYDDFSIIVRATGKHVCFVTGSEIQVDKEHCVALLKDLNVHADKSPLDVIIKQHLAVLAGQEKKEGGDNIR